MKILHSASGNSKGSTLVIAVIVTGLIGMVLAVYLGLVGAQNTSTMRSQAWNAAIPVIEAGVEDALSHLNAHGTTNLNGDGWSQSGSLYWVQRSIGSNYYIVSIATFGGSSTPVIESRGYVSSPLLVASAEGPLVATVGASSDAPTYVGRGVRISTSRSQMFVKGLVARNSIEMNGNNVTTDSFDSSDPNHSNNGLYDATKRKDHGDVAVNSSIVNSLNVGNANIYGMASTGPNGSVAVGPNGAIGDLAFHASHSGIEAGFVHNDMNVSFPEVAVPFNGGGWTPTGGYITNTTSNVNASNSAANTTIAYPWGASSITTNYPVNSGTYPNGSPGPVTTNVATNTTFTSSQTYPAPGTYLGSVSTRVVSTGPVAHGTWYDYYFINGTSTSYAYPTFTAVYTSYTTNVVTTVVYYDYILDTGNYQMSSLNGSVYVRGDAVLYVTTSANLSGIVIQPGETLKFYSAAANITLAGNINGLASAFAYFGLPSNTSLDIGGNGTFTGTVYAPDAALTMHGGGNNTVDFIGASITKSVTMNGHFNLHYDEALGTTSGSGNYIVTSWNEMTPTEVKSLPSGVVAQ